MISVASLLNPATEEVRPLPSPRRTQTPSDGGFALSLPPFKKPKMSKDAAVFAEGKVRSPVRYPPWEDYNQEVIQELKKFNLYPLGRIAKYHRHIPYNSDKKAFWEKTGRGAFEVFQYTFKMPGEEKEYNVMWDYNIGLVRITPFFKCCEYGKTIPAKVLTINSGLKDITHSITGGALAAQGYWMPFQAAKAVASTFCYRIRYPLAPLFGPDFIGMCTAPETEGYGDMTIDPKIVKDCTEEAQRYRETETRNSPTMRAPSHVGGSHPNTAEPWRVNTVRPVTARQTETSHGSFDTPGKKRYLPSPQSSHASKRLASPIHFKAKMLKRSSDPLAARLRNSSPEVAYSSGDSEVSPGAPYAQNTKEGDKQGTLAAQLGASYEREKGSADTQAMSKEDFKAAWTMIQLHLADSGLKDAGPSPRRRRASQ